MTDISKHDIVIVKFPFASSLKYKARPAVVISSEYYNNNHRDTLLIVAISSNIENKLDFEFVLEKWQESGLLKPSIFKSAIATIEKSYVLTKVGSLLPQDVNHLESMLETIC